MELLVALAYFHVPASLEASYLGRAQPPLEASFWVGKADRVDRIVVPRPKRRGMAVYWTGQKSDSPITEGDDWRTITTLGRVKSPGHLEDVKKRHFKRGQAWMND